jgi:hypothetical protein
LRHSAPVGWFVGGRRHLAGHVLSWPV